MSPSSFRSVLAPALRAFIEHRKALGYGDCGLARLLAQFDRYLVAQERHDPLLTRELVEDWVASGVPIQPRTRVLRLHAMRILGRFLAVTHSETYIPGPAYGPRFDSGFRPHIYTPAELDSLLAAAAQLGPRGSLRPKTFVALLGLLYCTGLRISEALALRLADVDFTERILWVQEGKFRKARALPLPDDVATALATYHDARGAYGHDQKASASFFVNEHRCACSYSIVCATFLAVSRRAGLRGPPGTRGPRIHDLRHTFAVHRLLAWYRDGGDVQARLPLLSDYLGHVSLVSTQVYLEITAELLAEAAQRFRAPAMPVELPSGGAP